MPLSVIKRFETDKNSLRLLFYGRNNPSAPRTTVTLLHPLLLPVRLVVRSRVCRVKILVHIPRSVTPDRIVFNVRRLLFSDLLSHKDDLENFLSFMPVPITGLGERDLRMSISKCDLQSPYVV